MLRCRLGSLELAPGIFSWRELLTQDVEGSTKFYTDLLGWTVDSMEVGNGMTYDMFMQGPRPIAGMLMPPSAEVPNMWINYITVEDLDATVEKAQSLGAHLHMPIMDVPGKGRFAGMADPQGAPIAFWQFV